MKTREKPLQIKPLLENWISSKHTKILLIFCFPFFTIFLLTNLVFASNTKDPNIIQLEESSTYQETATPTLTPTPTSTSSMTDLPTTTLTETLTQLTSTETQTLIGDTPTIISTIIEASQTTTIQTPFTLTPSLTITNETTTPLGISAAGLTQYYVSTTGSDKNTGDLSQPWKTIQHAVDNVNPGDTIFIMKGTYNESVKVQTSGTSSKPITLTNYNNQTVTINGGSKPALIPYKQLPQYWIVEGLNLKSTGTYTIYYDSWNSEGTCDGIDHWTFRNNYISGAVQICGSYTLFEGNEVDGSKNNGNDGNGIHDTYSVSHHNTFRNNSVHNFSKRGIWSMNRTHDNVFEGNTIYNISGLYCINTDGFGNVEWDHTIRNNILYNCGIGIYLENNFNSVVENNVIHDITNLGIGIINYGPHLTGNSHPTKCEVGGDNNQYGDTNGDNSCEGDITNNIIRQNLLYNHGPYGGIVSFHVGGVKILGNTIIGSSGSQWGVRLDESTYCPEITLQSNIIMEHSDAEIILDNYDSLIVDNNNLLYNSNSKNIYKTQYGESYWYFLNLAQYKVTSGKGQGSLSEDPKFVNASGKNFHLSAESPAIDSGVNIGLQYDLDGYSRPQGNGFDIGVYEYSSTKQSSPTPSPTSTNTPTYTPSPSPTSLPLPSPNLISPSNNETILTSKPTFDWEDVEGASDYTIQISKYSSMKKSIVKITIETSSYTPSKDLSKDKTLYWRVRANGDNGPSDWSEIWEFLIPNPPTTPSLVSPKNKSLLTDRKPLLDWKNSSISSSTSFDYYQLQIAMDSDFSEIEIDVNISGQSESEYTPAAELNPNTYYYWRVRAFNTLGQYSDWSTVYYFREAILAPVLKTPAEGVLVDNLQPEFDWNDVDGASSYTIQISKYSSFKKSIVKANTETANYTSTKELSKNKTLYWRVRANGDNGPSEWSAIRTFVTPNPPKTPSLVSPKNKSLLTDRKPLLDWKDSSIPDDTTFDHYQLQVAKDNDFADVVIDMNISGQSESEYTPTAEFDPNTYYYWRVRAFNTLGQYSSWSKVCYFREAILAPVLETPAEGVLVDNLRPEFDWNDVDGASSYTIQISKYSSLKKSIVKTSTETSDYTPTKDLSKDMTLYWRVRANGDNGPSDWSEILTFVSPNPPKTPSLVSPKNKTLLTDQKPLLDWKDSSIPDDTTFDHYQLQVAKDSDFADVVIDVNISDRTNSEYTPTAELDPNAYYYWRVRAFNTLGQYSSWSKVLYFREAILSPVLRSPAEGVLVDNLRPEFNWDDVDGASSYTIQISKYSSLKKSIVKANTETSNYTPTKDLSKDKTLYWRVRANGDNGPSDWSEIRTFVSPNPPKTPSLVSPKNKKLLTDQKPLLDWKDSSVPDGTTFGHYQLQVAKDSDFADVVIDVNISDQTNSEYTSTAELDPNAYYYWRVRAFNTLGQYSSWSKVRYFREAILTPVLRSPADGVSVNNLRPEFDWNDVDGTSSYTIQISKYSSFKKSIVKTNTETSNYTPTKDLSKDKTLYWRVRSNGDNGPSDWSEIWTFVTPDL